MMFSEDNIGQLHLAGRHRDREKRIVLMQAVHRTGSIARAAQDIGLSYRAAWDAVQSLNNLFHKPLVIARSGGSSGGSAELTPEGETCLRVLLHVQIELAAVMERLQHKMADEPNARLFLEHWSFPMKTSARNALHGTVTKILPGAVNDEVTLRVSGEVEIVTILTKHSVQELQLEEGRQAMALIKASLIVLVPGEKPLRTSARNCLSGKIVSIEKGAVNAEVTLELNVGKTLVAMLTSGSVRSLGLTVGDQAQALIKASHVILAVE